MVVDPFLNLRRIESNHAVEIEAWDAAGLGHLVDGFWRSID